MLNTTTIREPFKHVPRDSAHDRFLNGRATHFDFVSYNCKKDGGYRTAMQTPNYRELQAARPLTQDYSVHNGRRRPNDHNNVFTDFHRNHTHATVTTSLSQSQTLDKVAPPLPSLYERKYQYNFDNSATRNNSQQSRTRMLAQRSASELNTSMYRGKYGGEYNPKEIYVKKM